MDDHALAHSSCAVIATVRHRLNRISHKTDERPRRGTMLDCATHVPVDVDSFFTSEVLPGGKDEMRGFLVQEYRPGNHPLRSGRLPLP
jgi:hypothetical protein